MKENIFKFVSFFVLATVCVGFASCGDDDDVSPIPRDNQDIEVGGIRYNTTSNGEATVIGSSDNGGYHGVLVLPSAISFGGVSYRVVSIGDNAFSFPGGLYLTSITIPNSVTSIGEGAFEYCSGLTSITIGNSVTSIGDWAFSDCSGLTSITIPESVTSIGESAFRDCSGLTSITIPNNVTSILRGTFSGCSRLTSITIPERVTSIGDDAFGGCSSLKYVIIPSNVTSIGFSAFIYCSSLTSVTCLSEKVPSMGGSVFDGVPQSKATLYVPEVSLNAYKTARQWKEFGNILSVKGSGGKDDTSAKASYKNGILTIGKVQYKMVSVSGGTFKMGATSEQGYGDDNEKPVHNVTLSSYFIGQTEVTQALWTAVMETNPSNWKGDNLPVEQVSWDDCQSFITKLNKLTGQNFRLPTEAEWEYAARGGKQSRGYKYSGGSIYNVAWYNGNSNYKTHPVATMRSNELGLYDMSGNVYEWCQDWYDSYRGYSQTNPTGPSAGSARVRRGGCWTTLEDSSYDNCRISSRTYSQPSRQTNTTGFRLAL